MASSRRLAMAIFALAVTGYLAALMATEQQSHVLMLLAGGVVAAVITLKSGLLTYLRVGDNHGWPEILAILGVVALTAFFYDEHFALLMLATVLFMSVACFGLTIQMGYAGVVNFAGAAFFGVGSYAAAVLTKFDDLPDVLVLVVGGLIAAAIGSLLILPVLRTRGHYAALVTIAFGILFKTFLEVNEVLGGPQGLKVSGLDLFGWQFNDNIQIGSLEISFYANYVLLGLILFVLAFSVTRRLERSWMGLALDAVRLDEIAAAVFGISPARWKILAFTLGNFLAGVAGAAFAMLLGFIAPNNFTLGDSLIMVSIVILGGLGNPWGVPLAAAIVIVLPEKLQVLQEYRYLLYAALVIVTLLVRPQGLLPRGMRVYPNLR
ncbi:MAG: branched-chain amino acid ABC transporter permease [Burkholderiales bacterium]|nr:branched-chain amino acid ABC transporter permease [Pseudomonadota bacterium]